VITIKAMLLPQRSPFDALPFAQGRRPERRENLNGLNDCHSGKHAHRVIVRNPAFGITIKAFFFTTEKNEGTEKGIIPGESAATMKAKFFTTRSSLTTRM